MKKEAETDMEKNFYKLLNNSNFGYDCCRNWDNYSFQVTSCQIEELTYAQKFRNLFDPEVSASVNSQLLKEEVEKSTKQKNQRLKAKIFL